MSDFKENVEKLNVRGIVLSSVMTAFGLVVALVWKDTIIATVEYLLPNTDDGTLQGMYISAIAVTVLVIALAKFAITLTHGGYLHCTIQRGTQCLCIQTYKLGEIIQ